MTGSTPLKRNMLLAPGLLLLAVALVACASVVPGELRERVRSVSLAEVDQAPESYAGTLLLLGGEVLAVNPRGKWMEIEVLERPLGYRDRPRSDRPSRGRFAVVIPVQGGDRRTDKLGPGRLVTVVGEVRGRAGPSSGTPSDQPPLLMARYIHLWPPPLFPGGPEIGIHFGYHGSISF